MGLTGLHQPTDLAVLAAEAKTDPLGWLKTYAPRLLAQHIISLSAMADDPDARVRGSALKAAGDLTVRVMTLFQPSTFTGPTIRSQEDIPPWPDDPEITQKLRELLALMKQKGVRFDAMGRVERVGTAPVNVHPPAAPCHSEPEAVPSSHWPPEVFNAVVEALTESLLLDFQQNPPCTVKPDGRNHRIP
ncbi:MAG: hypothetical protein ACE5NC_13390 [Anaerolineae bacterium]